MFIWLVDVFNKKADYVNSSNKNVVVGNLANSCGINFLCECIDKVLITPAGY